MNTTTSLFEQAQLAEAAYSSFIDATGNLITSGTAVIAALQDTGFSETQATEFVKHWRVVDQYNNSQYLGLVGTGLSATVFERLDENQQPTGEYNLAVRGSQDIKDFTADTLLITTDGIAVSQLVDLYNYWQSLTHTGEYQAAKLTTQTVASSFLTALNLNSGINITAEIINLFTGVDIPTTYDAARAYFVGQGYVVEGGIVYTVESDLSTNIYSVEDKLRSGTGILSGQNVSVSGHSLGGHLAMVFSRLFPEATNDVTAVNGLGFKTGDMNVYNLFDALRNVSGTAVVPGFDASKIQNIYGIAGWEFAAMNNSVLQQPGGWNGIFIEDVIGQKLGHSASQMTDSLAVANLFIQLDSTLAGQTPEQVLSKINTILEQTSNLADQSLEKLVVGLSQLVLGTKPVIDTDDRDDLYTAVNDLINSTAYEALIGNVKIGAPPASADDARTDFGAFLSLIYLTPFALKPNDLTAASVLKNINPINADFALKWAEDSMLTAEQITNGEANFSDMYLNDRAAMLNWQNKFNAEDFINDKTEYFSSAIVANDNHWQRRA